MPTLTIEYQTDAERLILEQAIAYASGVQRLAISAPHGTVLAACEQLALTEGRKLMRDTLATAIQARADATDAKKKVPGSRNKGRHERWLLTAVGCVRLKRGYVSDSDGGSFPVDLTLGVDGYLTDAAERMASFAGTRDSFARAELALRELCGWDLDDNTIRKVTHEIARKATTTRDQRADDERFQEASGHVEVAIDAGKVNTDTGWRDVKIAVFCQREAGEPATVDDWDKRELPTPSVRTVIAAIEESATFTNRVRSEADRLDVTTAVDVTVLADGGEWIWNVTADVLPQATGVLDAFHAVEHVADAVKAVWGEATAETIQRIATGRRALLSGGKVGVQEWIAACFGELPAGASSDPLLKLAAYLLKHPTRLGYADRLSSGRSIGSGQVEGAVKQLVNRRLKQTGAKWKVAHVGPLVELAALVDTPDWANLWTAA